MVIFEIKCLLYYYFLMDQDSCFLLFYSSLLHGYVLQHERYSYLPLLFFMTQVNYDVLASHLVDYFNKFNKDIFVPQSVLFCACTLVEFLSRVQTFSGESGSTKLIRSTLPVYWDDAAHAKTLKKVLVSTLQGSGKRTKSSGNEVPLTTFLISVNFSLDDVLRY